MNTRKLICLAGFIILAVPFAVTSLTGPKTVTSRAREFNPLAVPRPAAGSIPIQATPDMRPAPQETPTAMTSIAAEPVPTPETGVETAAPSTANRAIGLILPAVLLLLILGALAAMGKRQWAPPEQRLARKRLIGPSTAVLLCLFLLGCQPPAADPLPPDEYLDHALNWLEANAVQVAAANWETVRAEAVAMAGQPQTTADTYPAIEYAIEQLHDPEAFMLTPENSVWQGSGLGVTAVYPQNIIVEVITGSPAAEAGIQVGDKALAINGDPPAPMDTRPRQVDFLYDALGAQSITLTLQRGAEQWDVTVTEDVFDFESQPVSREYNIGDKTAAYLELPTDVGTRLYPSDAQAAMARVDSAAACGWIIDLRGTRGGNLWTYFAALSPILGEGELGGFIYNDGSKEMWRLENGKVFWADEEREESYIRGRRYALRQQSPPVALLIGPLTEAAGELVVVAFQGWGNVRTFGEPTLGAPHLILHTPLSDEALLFVSGARGMDRGGTVYNGPIDPDESTSIAWPHWGSDNDPVIFAALDWLATQPACIP